MAFHDLTTDNSVCPAAKEILGLGLKFVPTPSQLFSKKKAVSSAQEITRPVLLKSFFAGKENNNNIVPKAQGYWAAHP